MICDVHGNTFFTCTCNDGNYDQPIFTPFSLYDIQWYINITHTDTTNMYTDSKVGTNIFTAKWSEIKSTHSCYKKNKTSQYVTIRISIF